MAPFKRYIDSKVTRLFKEEDGFRRPAAFGLFLSLRISVSREGVEEDSKLVPAHLQDRVETLNAPFSPLSNQHFQTLPVSKQSPGGIGDVQKHAQQTHEPDQ